MICGDEAITQDAAQSTWLIAWPVLPTVAVRDGELWVVYAWFIPGENTKDIFLVRPDGTGGHAILRDAPVVHVSPVWSPDGRQIVFAVVDVPQMEPMATPLSP